MVGVFEVHIEADYSINEAAVVGHKIMAQSLHLSMW